MKKTILILMIFVCALLFSCATDSGASSSDVEPVKIAAVQPVEVVPEVNYVAQELVNNPIIGKWASKYEFIQTASFNGIPLITDNAAFDSIPEDIRARKTAAEELSDQNRFLDSWLAYGEDDNEYIIALKMMSAVDTYTDSTMHQMFVFSNLEPDQDLYEYRERSDQKGEKIFWDPVVVANNYVKDNCNGVMPHILELALGCYYQSAALDFGDDWYMLQEDAYELSSEYFRKAITAGVYNDYALYRSIDAFLNAGYINDALEVIHCLERGDQEFFPYFAMEAQAYMIKGEYQNALPCAARSLLFASYPDDIASSAQLMADAFMYDSTDVDSARAVLEATKPYMGEEYFLGPVFMNLDILMFAKNRYSGASYDEPIIETLSEAFAWEYHDDNYLWELTDYFYNYDCIDLGIEWIEGILKEYDGDWTAYGNLNFELGQFYLQISEYQKALNCFNLAEENLKKAGTFDPDTSNIPYYQKQCREQLLSSPKKNKA